MRLLIVIFLLPFLTKANDPIDSYKHCGAGLIIGTTTGVITFQLVTKERWGISLFASPASAYVAGKMKEDIYDKKLGRGTPSKQDASDTTWGGVTGIFGLTAYFDIHTKRKHSDILITTDLYY